MMRSDQMPTQQEIGDSLSNEEIPPYDIKKLWEAANDHSIIMGGEWLIQDYESDTCPPMPSDIEAIEMVTAYLKETI